MQLHQINKLSYSASVETLWPNALQAGDVILLIEEAILRTQTQAKALTALCQEKDVSLRYLSSDVLAYGIQPTIGHALTDEEWVETTLSAESNISW